MVDTATHPGVKSKGLILVTLCLAALIINIDVTIVNVTLPSLVRELDATTTNLQWVVDAYSLVFAALILAAGSLSDRVGRKGILLVGLGVFAAGSLAGSLATTPAQLIAFRAVMGLGAAAIFPATLSLIANVFSERTERAADRLAGFVPLEHRHGNPRLRDHPSARVGLGFGARHCDAGGRRHHHHDVRLG